MADDQGAAKKGKRLAATATRRTAKPRAGKAKKTPRTGATSPLTTAGDLSHDVLHGRARPVIYAALTKRLRS